jgi:hypothetical protein
LTGRGCSNYPETNDCRAGAPNHAHCSVHR